MSSIWIRPPATAAAAKSKTILPATFLAGGQIGPVQRGLEGREGAVCDRSIGGYEREMNGIVWCVPSLQSAVTSSTRKVPFSGLLL